IAIVGEHAAALDYCLVEGGGIGPRDRGELALVGEGGESNGPDQHHADGRPQNNAAQSQASPRRILVLTVRVPDPLQVPGPLIDSTGDISITYASVSQH